MQTPSLHATNPDARAQRHQTACLQLHPLLRTRLLFEAAFAAEFRACNRRFGQKLFRFLGSGFFAKLRACLQRRYAPRRLAKRAMTISTPPDAVEDLPPRFLGVSTRKPLFGQLDINSEDAAWDSGPYAPASCALAHQASFTKATRHHQAVPATLQKDIWRPGVREP